MRRKQGRQDLDGKTGAWGTSQPPTELGELFVRSTQGNPDSRTGTFLLVESEIREGLLLESGIQLRGSGILLKIGTRNSLPGIRNLRRGIQNRRLSRVEDLRPIWHDVDLSPENPCCFKSIL